MPCIFCIAVFTLIAGAVTAAALEKIESQLAAKAKGGAVRRTVDSGSVARFELTVVHAGKDVPVVVTVYKDHRRVRIQILTHDLTPAEVEAVEDELAEALEADVVDRSDAESEAAGHAAHEHQREAESEEPEATPDRSPERPRQQAGPEPRP